MNNGDGHYSVNFHGAEGGTIFDITRELSAHQTLDVSKVVNDDYGQGNLDTNFKVTITNLDNKETKSYDGNIKYGASWPFAAWWDVYFRDKKITVNNYFFLDQGYLYMYFTNENDVGFTD